MRHLKLQQISQVKTTIKWILFLILILLIVKALLLIRVVLQLRGLKNSLSRSICLQNILAHCPYLRYRSVFLNQQQGSYLAFENLDFPSDDEIHMTFRNWPY